MRGDRSRGKLSEFVGVHRTDVARRELFLNYASDVVGCAGVDSGKGFQEGHTDAIAPRQNLVSGVTAQLSPRPFTRSRERKKE